MPATITASIDATSTSPTKVLEAEINYLTSTIVHRIANSSEPYITLGESGLRSGRLNLLYDDDDDALAADAILRKRSQFVLTFPERPSIEMTFTVVPPGIRRTFERPRWVIEVDYQEVLS